MRFALFFILAACQHLPTKKAAVAVNDLTARYLVLPKPAQVRALTSNWGYFGATFDFATFQSRLLQSFPSLEVFGSHATLLGNTGLDLRPLHKAEANPAALLLAIDLEMEILGRFHAQSVPSPRCLENFWSEWGLSIPAGATTRDDSTRTISQATKLESANELPVNETSKRLALFLRQSLGLPPDAKLKLLALESDSRAQFKLPSDEVYEIFSSPIDCKTLQAKQYIIPVLGKLKCMQKQSAAWMTVLAKESTVLGDDWVSEVRKRCERWVRPLSDQLRKDGPGKIQASPLARSWSLYPRLRAWTMREADRYEAAYRQSIE